MTVCKQHADGQHATIDFLFFFFLLFFPPFDTKGPLIQLEYNRKPFLLILFFFSIIIEEKEKKNWRGKTFGRAPPWRFTARAPPVEVPVEKIYKAFKIYTTCSSSSSSSCEPHFLGARLEHEDQTPVRSSR